MGINLLQSYLMHYTQHLKEVIHLAEDFPITDEDEVLKTITQIRAWLLERNKHLTKWQELIKKINQQNIQKCEIKKISEQWIDMENLITRIKSLLNHEIVRITRKQSSLH